MNLIAKSDQRYLTVVDLRPFSEQMEQMIVILGVHTAESTTESTDSASTHLLEGLPTYKKQRKQKGIKTASFLTRPRISFTRCD